MALAVIPKEKHLRVQGPRSHSGCRTCKLRHVKCSEGKPHCAQCIKAKRPCHYINDAPRDEVVKFVVYGAKQPSPFPGLTQSERRSLQHFQVRTAQELPSPFRSDLWSNVMLHVAQYAPSIRHAVFALSSMHEYYASVHESREVLHDFSMHHYNKAIRQIIRISEPEQSFDTLLLTAVMFCALEGLKGNFDQSLQHALAGIRIIARGREGLPASANQPQIPSDMLTNIFLSLQGQAMELGDLSVFPLYHGTQKKVAPMPASFVNTEDALRHGMAVMSEMLAWFDGFEEHYKDTLYIPAEVPEGLQPGFEAIAQRFALWDAAMQDAETLMEDSEGNQDQGFLILKLYQTILRIVIRTFEEHIYDFDAFEPEITGMLALAEVFLQSQGQYNIEHEHDPSDMARDIVPRMARPVFSMSLGVVPILFEIATRTRKPELQSHAMRLLASCRRREGVWDSQLAHRLAQKHIDLQGAVDNSPQSESCRWKVMVTDMEFSSNAKFTFKYTVVRITADRPMLNSFWLNGFNPCPDHEFFQGEA